ncbi:MAG: putative alpha/beta-hydrolase family hydrolase [Planctomycetota bacterium]|jgi:predicted alpha/beta-hydrolase family hydrolase
MTPLLIDEPANGDATTILLAHGAGASMEHVGMQSLTDGFVARGFRVVRFEFPFMQARREGRRPGPDRMAKLQACFHEVIASQESPVVLAGRSMGGRVATMIADEVEARAVIAFGYPFHPPRKPENLRTAHLENLQTPTLIVQGERDPFGTPLEVAGYELSDRIELLWIPDGDHSMTPRKKSGFTYEQHVVTALDRAAMFLAKL